LYTSAHCDDLESLRIQYDHIKSIDWCDLDERHPIAARNKYAFPDEKDEQDGWINVEHCLANTDELIDRNKNLLHSFESNLSKLAKTKTKG
jgi:hypothetical protein